MNAPVHMLLSVPFYNSVIQVHVHVNVCSLQEYEKSVNESEDKVKVATQVHDLVSSMTFDKPCTHGF